MTNQVIQEGQFIANDDPLTDDPDQQAELFTIYDEMRDEERAETWISVTRVPVDKDGVALPNAKGSGQLFQATLGTMTISDIIAKARRFIRRGENIIWIRVRGSKKGQRGSLFNKIFLVETENEVEKPESGDKLTDLMRVVQDTVTQSEARMNSFFERMMNFQAQALARPAPAPSDPTEMTVKMMGAMAAMMTALNQGGAMRPVLPAPATDPVGDLVKMIGVMKSLGVVNAPGGGREEDDDGDSFASIAASVAKVAGPMLQIYAANKVAEVQRAPVQRRRLAAPTPPAGATPPVRRRGTTDEERAAHASDPTAPEETSKTGGETEAVATQTEKGEEMNMNDVKAAINGVCDMAEKGKTPKEAARALLDILPPESDDQIVDMFNNDSFVDTCVTLVDRAEKHRQFFTDFKKEILAEFEPDPTRAGGTD